MVKFLTGILAFLSVVTLVFQMGSTDADAQARGAGAGAQGPGGGRGAAAHDRQVTR